MMPAIDRSLAVMIIGPLVGLAVTKGLVEPTNADALTQNIVTLVGLVMTIASVIIPLQHYHNQQDKNQKVDQTSTQVDQPHIQQAQVPTTTETLPPGV